LKEAGGVGSKTYLHYQCALLKVEVEGAAMGVPKPTEMFIRDLLQEELRKRGVTVLPEVSVPTPTGRLTPNM